LIKRLLLAICALGVAWTASAQSPEPLFIERASAAASVADQAMPAGRAIVEQSVVGMRIDRLFDRADGVATRMLLNAGNHSWVARFERLDHDDAGFRSWVGIIEEIPHSHVVVTERAGVVSGIIDAVGVTYQLRTRGPNSYLIERVDVSALGDEFEPIAGASAAAPPVPRPDVQAVGDDGRTIDVLMLYTPNARTQRGGTAAIEALISQIMSDTNTAFGRSGVGARVRLAGAAEFPLLEAPLMRTDLESLRYSATVRAARDSIGADLVQLLVTSPDQSACGYGYVLDSLSDTSFDAYSVADVACVAQYTPTHEMAHNMGSHHAPEDGAFGGLFPYSYGFKDPALGFRSVMAYGCSGGVVCGRILNFSNPSVTHNGGPTGTVQQNNARSINEASFVVANFRSSTVAPRPTLSAPAGLRSSVDGNHVSLGWEPVPAASSYLLHVGTRPGTVDFFSAPVASTSVSGLVGEGTYYWRVYAENDTGTGAASAESHFTVRACTAPGPPQSFAFSVEYQPLCADCPPTGFVTLAWSAPTTGTSPTTYIVEAGSAPGLANLVSAATGAGLGVATPAPSGAYYVRIRAQNACGTSPPSSEALITVR
jgi:hypothetical protein